MTAGRLPKENWRERFADTTEFSLMHIVRAADQLQSLLPKRINGRGCSWWQIFASPKLVELRADQRVEIEANSVRTDEVPSLNRFGF